MSKIGGVTEVYKADRRQGKTILYFYHNCAFPDWEPRYNVYEYRILQVLSKNYDVIVSFFTRSWSRLPNKYIIPRNAKFVFLPDLPLPKGFPRILGWALETATRIIRIALLVRNIRPDLVYANVIPRASGFCCGRAGVHPLLAAAWGSDIMIEAQKSSLLRFFAKLTLRSADAVVVDSEVHREAVLSLGCKAWKVCCFPWGIDLDRFKPQDSIAIRQELGWISNRIIISTRTHSLLYGVEYLIRAMPRVLENARDAKLLLLGEGPQLSYHKSLVRQLGIKEAVRFVGYVENEHLPGILNAADVYVSTSFSDGSSASLMEALGCGLPVVVTDIPGNMEWIKDGENGFLAPFGDSAALAVCILKLLQDDELRLRMRRANLSLARTKADWKANSLVLRKCIDDLVTKSTDKLIH